MLSNLLYRLAEPWSVGASLLFGAFVVGCMYFLDAPGWMTALMAVCCVLKAYGYEIKIKLVRDEDHR
jgi:hypothetical protein